MELHDSPSLPIVVIDQVVSDRGLSAIAFKPSSVPGRQIENFRLALRNTTVAPSTLTFPHAFYEASPTVVYGPVTEPTTRFVAGNWTTFTFAQPFTWDGSSNLLVELSFTLATDAVAGGGITMRNTGRANEIIQYYVHSSVPYPFSGYNAINGVGEVPAIQVTYK
jgi:hypothetical protein